MRGSLPRRQRAAASAVVVVTMVLVSACSSSPMATTPLSPASTSASVSPPSATNTVPGSADRLALGTNNPAQGDCSTNTSEAATSVGFVVLDLTPSSFQAEIQLQGGSPSMTYGVFMQQVPGSCPQPAANGGTLVTDSAGHAQASISVPRVPGATTFYVQLVPGEVGAPSYTSDRLAAAP